MTRVTKDKCLDIIKQFEPTTDGQKLGHLGIDGKFDSGTDGQKLVLGIDGKFKPTTDWQKLGI